MLKRRGSGFLAVQAHTVEYAAKGGVRAARRTGKRLPLPTSPMETAKAPAIFAFPGRNKTVQFTSKAGSSYPK